MGKRLFVRNLPFSTNDDELRQIFTRAGNIESATVMMDRATGRSRGFGFVEMATDEEAQRAIRELEGYELGGRALSVSEARERGDRPAYSGGGSSASPARSTSCEGRERSTPTSRGCAAGRCGDGRRWSRSSSRAARARCATRGWED